MNKTNLIEVVRKIVAEEFSGDGIKFSEEMRDYHSGQSYLTAKAKIDGETIGYVDFSIFNNKIHIDIAKVEEPYRRKGIATRLFHYIRLKNGGMKIIPGYSTEEGNKFYNNYKEKWLKETENNGSDPKPIYPKIFSQKEMASMGGNYNLQHGMLMMIPVNKIEGLDPEPASWIDDKGNEHKFRKGQIIKKPIEVTYDASNDVYSLWDGNHRVLQAKKNGDQYIKAFVEADSGSDDFKHDKEIYNRWMKLKKTIREKVNNIEKISVPEVLKKHGWIKGVDYFKEGKDAWGKGRPNAYGFYHKSIIKKLGSIGNYGEDLDKFLISIGLDPINIWVGSHAHGWVHRLLNPIIVTNNL